MVEHSSDIRLINEENKGISIKSTENKMINRNTSDISQIQLPNQKSSQELVVNEEKNKSSTLGAIGMRDNLLISKMDSNPYKILFHPSSKEWYQYFQREWLMRLGLTIDDVVGITESDAKSWTNKYVERQNFLKSKKLKKEVGELHHSIDYFYISYVKRGMLSTSDYFNKPLFEKYKISPSEKKLDKQWLLIAGLYMRGNELKKLPKEEPKSKTKSKVDEIEWTRNRIETIKEQIKYFTALYTTHNYSIGSPKPGLGKGDEAIPAELKTLVPHQWTKAFGENSAYSRIDSDKLYRIYTGPNIGHPLNNNYFRDIEARVKGYKEELPRLKRQLSHLLGNKN